MKQLLSVLRLVAIAAFVGLPAVYGPYSSDWTSYNGYSRGNYGYDHYSQMWEYNTKGYEYSVTYNNYTGIAYLTRDRYGKGYSYFGSNSI